GASPAACRCPAVRSPGRSLHAPSRRACWWRPPAPPTRSSSCCPRSRSPTSFSPRASTSSRPPSTRRSPPETAPPSARRPPRRADGLRRGPSRRTPDPGPPPEGHPMLVRSLSDIEDTDADIKSDTWRSKRLILAKERMCFSILEITQYEGTERYFWYPNHIEAVVITHGEGEVEDLATCAVHHPAPGTLYLLRDHAKHMVRVRKAIRCVCVFNPPVTGREVHDEYGVYPLITEDACDSAPEPHGSHDGARQDISPAGLRRAVRGGSAGGGPAEGRDAHAERLRTISRITPSSSSRKPSAPPNTARSEEHTSELQSRFDLVC